MRWRFMSRFPWFLPVLLAGIGLSADESPAIREALAALQRGDFAAAEQVLRPEVKARPGDSGALTLLGVALDSQKKYKEADEMHRRAAEGAPNSPDVLNNYANHLLGTGDAAGARKLYLRVVALDPADHNANVQLIRLALKKKEGAEALGYFGHLPAEQQDAPNLAPLHIGALYLAGSTLAADHLAARWLGATKGDLAASFSFGVALADAGQYGKAESFFTQALALVPSDFNVLFNLGVVAWHSGNYQRAREVLGAAQRQQPQNVDVLYDLACVEQAAGQAETAVALLAQAARLAPDRSDVQKLLAITTGDLGALADSAAAWDRYLRLEPNDDVARRERGFTAFQMGRFEEGVAELQRFVARHPEDSVGHFELGAAENKDNPAQALQEFDRAIALKADFGAAHSARGSLYYQMGKPEQALADLEAAAAQRPDDAVSLDRLGQTYLALDRAADAVRVLRRAAALAPDDSKTQLHLARALADAGEAAESKAAMDRFRRLGPVVNKAVPGGLVDYLSLTPEQRRADYRARVEKMVREHPDDSAALVTYLRLLLEAGDTARAAEVARKISALKPPATVLAEAGRALLEMRQYDAAQPLLEKAASLAPSPELQLDLAIAAFHGSGPANGLRLLDRIPDGARGGDYYLARAEMLYASHEAAEAAPALERALRASPGQSGVYRRACVLLMLNGRTGDALRVSGEALKALPQDRHILLLRAVVLEHAGSTEEAGLLLGQIQTRWPEWPDGWVAHGTILGMQGNRQDARAALVTAVALGADNAEVKAYLDALSGSADVKAPDLIGLLLTRPAPE
ncbi:MAG: tetratricopeptide repeat protein [Candidatus Sulfopaludibacter sp.]|nr:tetratricopeptide repeat protein [Candidatus Sulfopaludibacter sp.]